MLLSGLAAAKAVPSAEAGQVGIGFPPVLEEDERLAWHSASDEPNSALTGVPVRP